MKPGIRNAFLLVVVMAGIGCLAARFLHPPRFEQPQAYPAQTGEPPDIRDAVLRMNEAFEADWVSRGVAAAPRAPDLAIARRLSLALTGTIPSVEEIRAFEEQPPEGRIPWWLAHLFGDRRYGDYLAERLARMTVGVENGPFIVYRRHRLVSWLSDELMANRPYDELVRRLIQAEGIWTTRPEANFITVTIDQNNKAQGPDQEKLAGRVARAFLGVRLDCVQCHDDQFGDRWKQRDFHQLAAFFAQAEMSMTGLHDNPTNVHAVRYPGRLAEEPVAPAVPFHRELLPPDGSLRERLAAWVTHPGNRAFARALVNRTWALLFNRPLHEPVDDIPLDGPFPAGMEILADDLIAQGFDLQRLIRVIAATTVFQRDSRSNDAGQPVTPEQEAAFAAFPLTRLRPEQVAGSVMQSTSLRTIDAESHVIVRIARFLQQNEFVRRYGDAGEDEFGVVGGTIPQRLILMNGKLVHERTKEDLAMNAATRIGVVAPDDPAAVEIAYLAVLSRRPSPAEKTHFSSRLGGGSGLKRAQLMEDLFWVLINSTEFSWNH